MDYVMIGGAVAWVAMAGLGAWIASQKKRSPDEGVILGLIFGPLGVLIEALLPTGNRTATNDSWLFSRIAMYAVVIVAVVFVVLVFGLSGR